MAREVPMLKKNLEKLVRENPGVDREELREVRAILRELRDGGIVGRNEPGYRLASPFSQGNCIADEPSEESQSSPQLRDDR
jgi:hypothetical protein